MNKKLKKIISLFLLLSIFIYSSLPKVQIKQINDEKTNLIEEKLSDEQLIFESLEIVNNIINNYIDFDKYNYTLKLNSNNIKLDDLLFSTINNVYHELSFEEKEALEKLAEDDEEIKQFVKLMRNDERNDAGSEIKVSFAISQVSNLLRVAGLSSGAILIIKGAFLTMINVVKLFFTPLVVKIAITVAAILAISAVVIYNWDLISPYFKDITNIFINSAGRLRNAVLNVVEQIGRRANEKHKLIDLLWVYEVPLENNRVYEIAYIKANELLKGGKKLGFIEAYAVLFTMGLIGKLEKTKLINKFVNYKLDHDLKMHISELNGKGIIKDKSGVYTRYQVDAEKLAYAFGGYYDKKGKKLRNEIHDKTIESGHYQHYHPFLIENTHIWYGNPR